MKFLKKTFYYMIANEINTIIRYVNKSIYINPRDEKSLLMRQLESPKIEHLNFNDISKNLFDSSESQALILNGTFNFDSDIQKSLSTLHSKLSRTTRIILVLYNPLWSWLFKVAGKFGLIHGGPPETFLTRDDLNDLCKLTGYEMVRLRPTCILPLKVFGLGTFVNKLFCSIPVLRNFALTYVITLRPIIKTDPATTFLSIVIPARNEAGNIENAILRMPTLPCKYEIIFIEGNSTDDTWTVIQEIQEKYKEQFQIKIGRQTGKGKANAVEKGFEIASGNLLTILDADLTMPPEALGLFVNAYLESKADFINGSRLLYPMEGKAMKFLNKIGNFFFANSLSFVLEERLTDSLCGTKLFSKIDYLRFLKWRTEFGRFDPFGDFDLLFPASTLGLGVINIPIKYYDRTYGETNISRFSHGFMLLKMTIVGFIKIRLRLF